MKNTPLLALALGSTLLLAPAASAADLYWYPSGANPQPQGGGGAWNTSSNSWNSSSDGSGTQSAWNNANSDGAVFGGTAGTVTNSVAITAGSLSFLTSGYVITNGGLTNTLTLSGGTGVINVGSGMTANIRGSLSSSSLLTKTGTGTLALGGASQPNSLTGGIYLQEGEIRTQSGTTGILGTTTLRMANGTTLASTFNGDASIGPSRASGGDGYLIDTGATVTFNTAVSATLSTVNNAFAGTNATIIKTGVGTLTLNQNSGNLTDSTWRVDQGVLAFSITDRFGASTNGIVLNGGGIRLSGGTRTVSRTITLSNVAGNSIEVQAARTLTLDTANQLTGAGGFTKADTGQLTISASQNFAGSAVVSAGTMVLSSAATFTAASGVAVNSGATLSNNSSVALANALTLAEGAIIAGTGAFAPTNLTISGDLSDGFTTFALGSTALTKTNTLAMTLSGITSGSYTLFSGTALSGTFGTLTINGTALTSMGNGNFQGSVGGFDYTFTDASNVLGVVPEPSTMALAGLGMATLLWMRRKRSA